MDPDESDLLFDNETHRCNPSKPKKVLGRPRVFVPLREPSDPDYSVYRKSLSLKERRALDRCYLPVINVDARSELPQGYFTRQMVCQRTGITVTEFRSYVVRGLVQPVARNHHQWFFYGQDAIDWIKRELFERDRMPGGKHEYTASDAGKVIRQFRKGNVTFEKMVADSELHPLTVRAIIQDFQFIAQGGLWFTSEQIKVLAQHLKRPLKKVKDVLSAVEELAREQECISCGIDDRSTLCLPCAKKRILAAEEQRRERRAAKEAPPSADEG